jgi:hypothetical protein
MAAVRNLTRLLYRGAHLGCHGVYLFLTLFGVSSWQYAHVAASGRLSSHVRAVGLVGAPRRCEDGPVLLGLPWPDTDVQKLVLDRRLVDHVGHPGVP